VFDDNRASRLHSSERRLFEYWSAPERLRAEPDRTLLEYLRVITPTDFWTNEARDLRIVGQHPD
jgi:hypothetical protein